MDRLGRARARKGKGRPIAELPIPPGTADPDAYRDSRRLAYRAEVPVNWCPELGTVLANEEVIDGKSERGGYPGRPHAAHPVDAADHRLRRAAGRGPRRRRLAPADQGHAAQLGRPQRGRRGRFPDRASSTDREVDPRLHHPPRHALRRDLHGAGARASAGRPAHDRRPASRASKPIARRPRRKSDLDRTDLAKTKTGVFTGGYAINPVNGQSIPVWIADYVLMGYGTGAIMAVPGHDERDFEFAQAFDLPIVRVVAPSVGPGRRPARPGRGRAGRLGQFAERRDRARRPADRRGEGRHHRLAGEARARQEDDQLQAARLAVLAPAVLGRAVPGRARRATTARTRSPSRSCRSACPSWRTSSRPASPSRRSSKAKDWVRYSEKYRRETNTMPQWAGSCWYYLRYIDPHNDKLPWDPEKERYWMPVDLYVGGAEHAVLHLLYSRFWHKVLFDRGLVSTAEPFRKLVNQGMILGETEYTGYRDADGTLGLAPKTAAGPASSRSS